MSRGQVLLQARGLRLTLGGAPLFDDVSFALHKGERCCLIGANGAGKSTLLRMLSGLIEPDGGEISAASGVVIARVPQEPDFGVHATLREYVRDIGPTPAPAHAADAALDAWGLDPERACTGLSGGEARRAALARAFAAEPDVLLLDEPTNHLDIAAIEQLEGKLGQFSGAALIISHDRRFLEAISGACLWLRQRVVRKLEAGFGQFETWAEELEKAEEKALSRLETQLRAEEHWLQRGVTARRSRNEGRRRKLEAMRVDRRERIAILRNPKAALEAEKGVDPGKIVIEAKGIAKTYETAEGPRAIVQGLSLKLMRGDRLGVIGPNGAGKSTLLNLLLQRLEPDAGAVRIAPTVEIAYVDQGRSLLDPTKTVWDALCPLGGDQVMVRGRPRHVAAYAKDFLFTQAQLRQPAGALSGGERNRLALAVSLAKPANLLVLDEPTNDLDMDTLDMLEEMLAGYDGTVLIVSHDRAFLDGVATQVLGPLGDGRWAESPGGYADFEREYGGVGARAAKARTAAAAPPPTRAPKPAARKLSYKDARRLEELEGLVPKLEAEIAGIEAQLSDANLALAKPAVFEAAAARLAAARDELDAAETEWLELDALRATLAAGEG